MIVGIHHRNRLWRGWTTTDTIGAAKLGRTISLRKNCCLWLTFSIGNHPRVTVCSSFLVLSTYGNMTCELSSLTWIFRKRRSKAKQKECNEEHKQKKFFHPVIVSHQGVAINMRLLFQLLFRGRGIIRRMRILVIEDEHRIANTIKKGLEQERYVVDVAYTGPEGHELGQNAEYD